MARSRYYHTPHWRALRKQALDRDGYRCTVQGCGRIATHVDHVKTRPPHADGPTVFDVLPNVRSLCVTHDGQVKETAKGVRARGGEFKVIGCDEEGWPHSPAHNGTRPAS